MAPRKIIIDTTPARRCRWQSCWRSPARRSRLLGITALAGNVPLALTRRNAGIVTENLRQGDVAVYPGASVSAQGQAW